MKEKQRLWSQNHRNQDLNDLFARLAKENRSSVAPLPHVPFQFSNFVSVIIKPEEEGFFKDLFSAVYSRFVTGLEKDKAVSCFPEYNLDYFLNFQKALGKVKFLETSLQKNTEVLDAENFNLFKIFDENNSMAIQCRDQLLNQVNQTISSKLTVYIQDLPKVLLRFNMLDQETQNVLRLSKEMHRKIDGLRIFLQKTVTNLQEKLRKRGRIEQTKNLLLMMKKAKKLEQVIEPIFETKSFMKIKELIFLQKSFTSISLQGEIFSILTTKIGLKVENFSSSLCHHVLASLLSAVKEYLESFSTAVGGVAISPLSFPKELALLNQLRFFCGETFLEQFREKISKTVRDFHIEYFRNSISVSPSFALFSSYSRSIVQVLELHRITMETMNQEKENALFSRLLLSQAHRFLKKLIDRFDLEGMKEHNLAQIAEELINLAQKLGASTNAPLFSLPMHLNRLVLNARQQKILSKLQVLFEEESWSPVILQPSDFILLKKTFREDLCVLRVRLGITSQTISLLRCLLIFLNHLVDLRDFARNLPETQEETELKSMQTVELFLERLTFLLVEGYATEYKRLNKINTRVLALAVLQLELLGQSATFLFPLQSEKFLSHIQATVTLFLDKIVFIMQCVLEKSAAEFFSANWTIEPPPESPSAPIQEIVRSFRQLYASVSQLLPPAILKNVLKRVEHIAEKVIIGRLRMDSSNVPVFKEELAFLLTGVAVFSSQINLHPLEG